MRRLGAGRLRDMDVLTIGALLAIAAICFAVARVLDREAKRRRDLNRVRDDLRRERERQETLRRAAVEYRSRRRSHNGGDAA